MISCKHKYDCTPIGALLTNNEYLLWEIRKYQKRVYWNQVIHNLSPTMKSLNHHVKVTQF